MGWDLLAFIPWLVFFATGAVMVGELVAVIDKPNRCRRCQSSREKEGREDDKKA